jgi:hypothetical protein
MTHLIRSGSRILSDALSDFAAAVLRLLMLLKELQVPLELCAIADVI